MIDNELIEKGKALSKKYHWHFDRVLKYRNLLSSYKSNSNAYKSIFNKMIDSEIKCVEIDDKIAAILIQLQTDKLYG